MADNRTATHPQEENSSAVGCVTPTAATPATADATRDALEHSAQTPAGSTTVPGEYFDSLLSSLDEPDAVVRLAKAADEARRNRRIRLV